MERAILKPNEERRLLRGHAWAFRNEFKTLPALEDGALVDIYSDKKRFVGRGFYQAEGGIAIRVLTRHQTEIDASFFAKRIAHAKGLRDIVTPDAVVYRWIHGESDGLPGLIADRYGAVVSVNTVCRFYAAHWEAIAHAFRGYKGVDGVRFVSPEGVTTAGDAPETQPIEIGGLRFEVPFARAQKTGLFLDQLQNILAMRPFAANAKVLDGHCYYGLWSCHAAAAGADSVLGVDTSAPAIEQARRHAEMNNLGGVCSFACGDIAETLQEAEGYDLVILDPPALAKSKAHFGKAMGLYQSLNRDAIKALKPGGFLVTSSCSQQVDRNAFEEMLKRAVRTAQREAVMLRFAGAGPDHPVSLAMPETAYLKCAALRVY